MPLLLAQRAKAFQCKLYTLLEESLRGFAAICTTVSGKWWLFKTSLIISTRLDPIVLDLGDIGGVWGWAHTGTGGHLGEGFEDVCSTVKEEGAMVGMDVVTQSWWPRCLEILGLSGEFWGQWEPEETHKLVQNRPRIGTGRLLPILCRPGKEKHRRRDPLLCCCKHVYQGSSEDTKQIVQSFGWDAPFGWTG